MIVDENISKYLHSLDTGISGELEGLRRKAEELGVPVIRRETESFLKVFLNILQPEHILEIGSGIAYSSIFMSRCCESIARIDTIENYPPRIAMAKENLKNNKKIYLVEGDACKIIKDMTGCYELIFLDGPKAQYPEMLPDLLRLLGSEGVLIADNVLLEGDTAKSRFAVERRDRTMHERMRMFLKLITGNEELLTTVQAIGDGLSISLKK